MLTTLKKQITDFNIDQYNDSVRHWLHEGKVSWYMTFAIIAMASFMANSSLGSLLVMILLAILGFAMRWVAKFEERMESPLLTKKEIKS